MGTFVNWYNHEHRHTGIGPHTPADVHFGLATQKAAERSTVLAQARLDHPERFAPGNPNPKILDLQEDAWINKPPTLDDTAVSDPDQAAA